MVNRRAIRSVVRGLSILALAAGAFLFYARVWPQAPYRAGDTESYMEAGRDLSDGHLDKPHARAPGYPLFLVLSGSLSEPTRTLFFVQLGLQIAAVFLVVGMLKSIGCSPFWTILIALLGLLPPFVQMAGWALTETLAQFCLVLGVVLVLRFVACRRRVWLAGASLAFAYAAITRPTFQLASVAVACLLFGVGRERTSSRERLADGLILIGGTVIALGGYSFYGRLCLHEEAMTPTLGYNLAVRTPALYGLLPDPATRRILLEARNEAFATDRNVSWSVYRVRPRLRQELGMTDAELEAWLRSQCLRTIARHPIQYGEIVAESFARFWFPLQGRFPLLDGRFRLLWYAIHFAVIGAVAFEAIGFVAFLVCGWIGLPLDVETRRAWSAWAMAVLLILYNAVISCMLDSGEVRQRAATELLLLLAMGAGAVGSASVFRHLRGVRGLLLRASGSRVHGSTR